jgi:amino acid transporter
MNITSPRFAVICALITALLCALHYFSFDIISEKTNSNALLLMYVFLGLMYWLSFYWTLKAMEKSPRQFVNTFMLVSVTRMLLSLILLIPVIMKNKETETGKFIAVYFVVGYFVFLITEIAVLFKVSKRKG